MVTASGSISREPVLDLINPTGSLARDPEAIAVAYDLNRHPAIDLDGDPGRFTHSEWVRALANPYVMPHAKTVLLRMEAYFSEPSGQGGLPLQPASAFYVGRTADPSGLPPERA